MKKLLFIIVIFTSIISFSKAEDSRWIKKGAFWELPDSISNIQFTPEGDYFFVLDKVNLRFNKYTSKTGEILSTYDIFVPDSIGKLPSDKILIQLSPDTKTYTVSSLYFPIIYFIELNTNKILFSRRIQLPEIKNPQIFPFLSIIFKNLIIYQQPYSGYWSGEHENSWTGSHTIIINTHNNDSTFLYYYGVSKLLTTKEQDRTIFLTEDGRCNYYDQHKEYKSTNVNSFNFDSMSSKMLIQRETININQTEDISLSKQGDEVSYIWVPSNLMTILKIDTDKVDTLESDDKIYNFSFINDYYCAILTKNENRILRIYNREILVQVDSISIDNYTLKSSLIQNPNYSEVSFITNENKLIKLDFTRFDSLFAAFKTEYKTASTVVPVHFDNLTTGGATSYLWEFGDGETSTEENPSHLYANVGVYSVKLTAFNATDTSTYSIKDYIKILPYIKANFEIEKLTDIDSLVVITKNFSEGNIVDYKWIVGDSIYTDKEPIFTIYKPGLYDVTLIVSNGDFLDTLTKVDYLNIIQSPIPHEYFQKHTLFLSETSNYNPDILFKNKNNYFILGNKNQPSNIKIKQYSMMNIDTNLNFNYITNEFTLSDYFQGIYSIDDTTFYFTGSGVKCLNSENQLYLSYLKGDLNDPYSSFYFDTIFARQYG
jgi:PKD repeat protein